MISAFIPFMLLVFVAAVSFACLGSAFKSAKDGAHEGWHLPALYLIPLSIALGFILLSAIVMETQRAETEKTGSVAKP